MLIFILWIGVTLHRFRGRNKAASYTYQRLFPLFKNEPANPHNIRVFQKFYHLLGGKTVLSRFFTPVFNLKFTMERICKMSLCITNNVIDINSLREGTSRKLAAGLISPAVENTGCELAPEHSAEPIKSMDDIFRISQFLIDSRRYRDNMLFIVGINFGLRASDLRMLRFSNLINDNCTFRDSFPVFFVKCSASE